METLDLDQRKYDEISIIAAQDFSSWQYKIVDAFDHFYTIEGLNLAADFCEKNKNEFQIGVLIEKALKSAGC